MRCRYNQLLLERLWRTLLGFLRRMFCQLYKYHLPGRLKYSQTFRMAHHGGCVDYNTCLFDTRISNNLFEWRSFNNIIDHPSYVPQVSLIKIPTTPTIHQSCTAQWKHSINHHPHLRLIFMTYIISGYISGLSNLEPINLFDLVIYPQMHNKMSTYAYIVYSMHKMHRI